MVTIGLYNILNTGKVLKRANKSKIIFCVQLKEIPFFISF